MREGLLCIKKENNWSSCQGVTLTTYLVHMHISVHMHECNCLKVYMHVCTYAYVGVVEPLLSHAWAGPTQTQPPSSTAPLMQCYHLGEVASPSQPPSPTVPLVQGLPLGGLQAQGYRKWYSQYGYGYTSFEATSYCACAKH